ncbi:hypothetical protein BGAL_0443g00110 [Botrytis galanthina]|uniref:Carrier domain-containing protein n=1 Tax=Botrytis galanthina TaxID=278940 RepID=A0A4S8QYH0_9HELO|nr:hypothetical protein BGAL_0443g00110 [Botrytis galanthina]
MATNHESVAQWQDALLPHVVDRLARDRPDAKYGEWVTSSSVITITYVQLANIINGLAWLLVEQLDGPGSYGAHAEVLAYVGANDVRYSALVLAANKAGYTIFVTSPRNSPAAHRALFGRLKCRTLITSNPIPPPANAIFDAVKPLHHFTVPSVEELLIKQYPPYTLNKTFQELRQTHMVVMHTSGSTGLPKPLIWTHETCTQVLNANGCQTPGEIPSVNSLISGKRVIVTLPPFHGALLAQLLVGAIPYGNVVIAPIASPIPTAHGVVDALKQSPADVAILVPSVVAELAHNEELLDYCAANLKTIIYIGGDLPQDLGDRVASRIYLRCLWGATETGIVPQLLPSELLPSALGRTLWRYALADMQPCFTVPGMQQLEEYRTKDLFEPHPSIPDLWCWRARSDDIIVFLNGEKTNPISMEQHIMASNPEVSGALVIGAQKLQAALLIEPVSDLPLTTAEQAALIERIWPSIEESNRTAPAHACVEKSFVLVIPTDRRLIRAPKGTFMRSANISQYTEEIEKLYKNADVLSINNGDFTSDTRQHVAPTGLDATTRLIRQQILAVTAWPSLDNDDNLFDRGMDSLQGLQLTRTLRRIFYHPGFALSTVYQNPTVSQLVTAILTPNVTIQNERGSMEDLLATYRKLIHHIPVSKETAEHPKQASEQVNVFLTGSTGIIGTHLLQALLSRDRIARIFCLNRGKDGGRDAQYKNFVAAGIPTSQLDKRVTFIRVNVESPFLGLDSTLYDSLRSEINLIVHAAWPVNFNLPLSAFRPQLAALDTPAPFGYGRAKFLAELLVDAGGRHLGSKVATTVIRVGQVAGPVNSPGIWNPREWLPSLVLSSLHLGQISDSLGPRFDNVDFVPVDLLSDILVDLATAATTRTADNAATVFNLRNPQLVSWSTLLSAVVAIQPLQIVSPATWLASLRASSEADYEHVAANPAVKLLHFFEGLWAIHADTEQVPMQPLVVEKALEASPAMRKLDAVKVEWMHKWVEEWVAARK